MAVLRGLVRNDWTGEGSAKEREGGPWRGKEKKESSQRQPDNGAWRVRSHGLCQRVLGIALLCLRAKVSPMSFSALGRKTGKGELKKEEKLKKEKKTAWSSLAGLGGGEQPLFHMIRARDYDQAWHCSTTSAYLTFRERVRVNLRNSAAVPAPPPGDGLRSSGAARVQIQC